MMANTVDMQQLLMSIDSANGSQELFNQMNRSALLSGGSASPSSLASSGAPSSSSVLNEGCTTEDKDTVGDNASWLSALMMQQANPQLLELLAASGGGGANALSSLVNQLSGVQQNEHSDEGRESSATPPATDMPVTSLAGLVLPSTSSATSEASSQHASVIVSGNQHSNGDISETPAKRSKTNDDASEALMKSTFDNLLLAQMSSLTSQLPHGQAEQQENMNEESCQYKCSECDKEFENVAYLEQHKITHHTNLVAQRIFGGLFPQSMAGLPFMLQSPIHQQLVAMQHELDSPSLLSTPKQGGGAVKRQYSSNGKNYCDLCNKEVCNKYFLRTHMLKMHGIVIDENKTVIANIDTLERERMGNLSFRCDTCLNEFKSRHQLRQHKQDVHGVLPLQTPRANAKSSVPSTPTHSQPMGTPIPQAVTPTSLAGSIMHEEKCQLCDKRLPAFMMAVHMQQEHLGGSQMQTLGAPDINQVMALLNQASRTSRDEEKSSESAGNVLRCGRCQYTTRDARNLEMHQERHDNMNEAKVRASEDDEDEALKLTTEAAFKMVVQNKFDNVEIGDMEATAAALNLSLHKGPVGTTPIKKEICDEEKVAVHHERNSHTSGSISPSGDSLPEGFGKPIGNDKNYEMQTFVVRTNDEKGSILAEFVAQLPVRSLINAPRQLVFELVPTSSPN